MATIQIDNRGLQPPEPMTRILAELAKLEPGDELAALMDREPHLLYRELERRGLAWEFTGDEGSYVLTIRRSSEA